VTADDLPAAFETLPAAWRAVLSGWTPAACAAVAARVKAVSGDAPIGPPDPFRALRMAEPAQVKVVLFGQDPYPTAGHADGLAFSAGNGKPRSLRRVFEVMAHDRPDFQPPTGWQLDAWARRGVLLLNTALSVEIGRAGSHLKCGWQALTSEIVAVLASRPAPPTFLLWGGQARDFFASACPAGAQPRVLVTRHPSYDFERRFMADGSHFSETADLVDWWAL
jgi:uracil-DNA glycosylase